MRRFLWNLSLGLLCLSLAGCPQGSGPGNAVGRAIGITHITNGYRVVPLVNGGFVVSGTCLTAAKSDWRVFRAELTDDLQLVEAEFENLPLVVEPYSGPKTVALLPDGGWIVAGLTQALDGPGRDMSRLTIERRDNVGGIVWSESYGEPTLAPFDVLYRGNNVVQVVVQDRDDSLVYGAYILNVDIASGALDSTWDISSPFNKAFCLAGAVNGDTIEAGLGQLEPNTGLGVVVRRIGSGGEFLWTVRVDLDPDKEDTPRSIAEAPNSDLLLAITGADVAGVARLSSEGQLLWARSDFLDGAASGYKDDDVRDVVVTPDGYIGVTGTETQITYIAQTIPVTRKASFIALLDGDGNRIWKTTIAGANLYGLAYTAQDSFIATGGTSDGKLYVVEVDMDGNVL